MNVDQKAFSNPQASGFQTIIFDGSINESSAIALIKLINRAIAERKKGVWVSINCGGGSAGAGRVIRDYLASTSFPGIAHAVDAFSEGSSLLAAFPARTIAPVGKIGFHQTSMQLAAGPYAEGKISDLLQQVKGHNRAMINHLALCLAVEVDIIQPWVYEGRVFVGHEAKEASIVHDVLTPFHPQPTEHWFLDVPH